MILVTGASGNVGSAPLAELRALGAPVRPAYRDPARARAALLDLAYPAGFPAALDGDIARVAARVLTTGGHVARAYRHGGAGDVGGRRPHRPSGDDVRGVRAREPGGLQSVTRRNRGTEPAAVSTVSPNITSGRTHSPCSP